MSKSVILELPLDEEKKPAKKERRRARGSGHVYERGGTLWIQYRVGGRRFRESAHTDKWTVAGDLLHRRITEAQDGIVRPGRIAYESLRDALYSDYLTRGHKSLLTRADGTRFICTVSPALDDFFADYRAEQITVDAIKRFIRKRQKDGVSNSAINRSISSLRRMFWLQVEENRFPASLVPHFPMLPSDQPRADFLTPDEYAKLLAELHSDSKPLLIVAYHCGARRGELLKLRWDDVDLKVGIMTFRDTKNSEDREVPIIGPARMALEQLRAAHPDSELVFVRVDGQPIKTFRKAWLAAVRRAGLQGKRFHGTRRSAAVNLMAAGIDSQTARRITGHKDARTFEGYRVLLRNDILAAGKVLEQHMGANSVATVSATVQGGRKSKS
jgi:integrase